MYYSDIISDRIKLYFCLYNAGRARLGIHVVFLCGPKMLLSQNCLSLHPGEYMGSDQYLMGKNAKLSVNNCIAKMEVGCLKHPVASTIGSQLLDEDCSHGWQILATQP